MPITVRCDCGKEMSLKEELAGKKVRCPACQNVVAVPAATEEETFKMVEPESAPAPVKTKKRRGRDESLEEIGDEARRRRRMSDKSSGMVRLAAMLGGGLVLAVCCLGCGVGGWLYFFNFTGNELVGTWETDTQTTKDRYAQIRFTRFGNITVAAPNYPTSVTGNWRVVSRNDKTYTIEVSNSDGSGKLLLDITMLTNDRIRVVIGQAAFELRRM
jgi:hypothetical protein